MPAAPASRVAASFHGTTIVGEGYYDGDLLNGVLGGEIGWIAVIPEPATAPLVGLELLALAAVRRRR